MIEMGKPRVIEISGMPTSGKTTLVNGLFEIFGKNGYKCKVVPESASEMKRKGIPKEEDLTLNYFLMTVLRTTEELLLASENEYLDFILVDRGLVDRLIWNEWMKKEELIDLNSYAILKSFMEYVYTNHTNWKTLILLVSFQEAMRRHKEKTGPIMNKPKFTSMEESYKDPSIIQELEYSNFEKIDTTNRSRNEIFHSAMSYLKIS